MTLWWVFTSGKGLYGFWPFVCAIVYWELHVDLCDCVKSQFLFIHLAFMLLGLVTCVNYKFGWIGVDKTRVRAESHIGSNTEKRAATEMVNITKHLTTWGFTTIVIICKRLHFPPVIVSPRKEQFVTHAVASLKAQ